MPGGVIGKNLSLGYAGKVSRNGINKITARQVKSILDGNSSETMAAIPFGKAAVVNTDNTYSLFGASGAGVASAVFANFGGIAVSEVKQSMTYGYGPGVSAGQFEPNSPCDVLQAGTTTVFCTEGTPTANGLVYIVTAAGSVAAVGDFVATATPDSGTAVQVVNARWTNGKMDPSGITEVVLLAQANA